MWQGRTSRSEHLWTPRERKKNLRSGAAHSRVLTSVRPLIATFHLSRACMGVREPVQIMKACSKHLCHLVFPIPSLIDCCAIPFRSTFLHSRRPLAVTAMPSRPELVDPALRQKRPDDAGHLVGESDDHEHGWLTGKHPSQPRFFRSPTAARLPTTALAPMISRRRSVRSPIFEVAPSFCFPPVECCNGVSPSHAAKSRPLLKGPCGSQGNQCRRRYRPNARDRRQSPCLLIFPSTPGNLDVEPLDAVLQ